jgi:hypothetical protein
MRMHNTAYADTASHKLYSVKDLERFIVSKQRLLLSRKLETYYPAQRGRQSTFSCFSASFEGKVSTACTSTIRFTVSTMPGKWSISQRAASALAAYVRACSSSILARLVCCAAWSKQANSIFCSTSRGFLQSSRNSKDGNAGTMFTGWALAATCTLLKSYIYRNGTFVLVVLCDGGL